jgi:hypothetical protein
MFLFKAKIRLKRRLQPGLSAPQSSNQTQKRGVSHFPHDVVYPEPHRPGKKGNSNERFYRTLQGSDQRGHHGIRKAGIAGKTGPEPEVGMKGYLWASGIAWKDYAQRVGEVF